MKWIVIIALTCYQPQNLVLTNTAVSLNSASSLSYSVPSPPSPEIKVFPLDTKEEAEKMAVNYFPDFSCSYSSIIIDPTGRAYSVKYVENKKTVLKEVTEVVGYELVWEALK